MRPADQLFNIRDVIRYALSEFGAHDLWFGHGTDSAWDEAVALVYGSLNLDLEGNDRLLDANLTMAERELLVRRVEYRVKDRIPTPYLLGKAAFHGLTFKVTEDTLIPRSPIGELLTEELEPWLPRAPHRILDLCTGSGCLGLLAAHIWPEAEVILADISKPALAVAQSNIDYYGLNDRVSTVESDLLDQVHGPFDLVICNPPYVDQRDMDELPPNTNTSLKWRWHPGRMVWITGAVFSRVCRRAWPLMLCWWARWATRGRRWKPPFRNWRSRGRKPRVTAVYSSWMPRTCVTGYNPRPR